MSSVDRRPQPVSQQILSEAESCSKSEWQRRCVERMLAIETDIDAIEATQIAIAVWSIERFRRSAPEAVAELVFTNGPVRPSRT